MKKLLVLLLCVVFFNGNAQKMTSKFLEGDWTSNGEATEINFKRTDENKLVISEVSSTSGIKLKVLRHRIKKNILYLETLFEPNNFESITKFIIIDQYTMVANVLSDYPGQVIYKRILNDKIN
jgi:hypothetical protein